MKDGAIDYEMNLRFTSPLEQERGIIADLLKNSYRELVLSNPGIWGPEEKKWEEFDQGIFEHPDSVGSCVFLTWIGKRIAGFGSYDPRHGPDFGIMGHNCILPEFRGRGHVKQQLLEILRRLQSMSIKRAKASTGSHPFFIPARRMYISCGFIEVGRRPWDVDPSQEIVEFEKRVV
jgi:ribosomal protein S18 acetylase RimI-like enzyme